MIERTSRDTFDLRTYLVTDTAMCGALGVPETVRSAVAGGVTVVQLRDHDATDEEFVALGREILRALEGSGVPLLVDDRVHLVAAIGAHGAHIGQHDMPLAEAREMLGPAAVIGLSISSLAQYDALLADGTARSGGLDYLGVGPVRDTATKTDADPALGWRGLRDICARSSWPIVAIGGVKAADAGALQAAGADGMAVVSAVCGTPDPQAAARRLTDAWSHAHPVPNSLTIAGSDPSGGAGIQADLKSFSAQGAYGMSVITALTAQNTQGVTGIHAVPLDFVRAQLDTLLADVRVDTVKIGMLATADLARVVGEYLSDTSALGDVPVVLDPVMVATSGDRLLDDDAVDAVRALLPSVDLVTPNLPELAVLTDSAQARDLDDLARQAELLRERFGAANVYAKGGHLSGTTDAVDLLVGAMTSTFAAPWEDTRNTHGTGCSLSSALAALRPQRLDWVEAAADAKAWLARAIGAADTLRVGRTRAGHGPVHHFVDLWSPR